MKIENSEVINQQVGSFIEVRGKLKVIDNMDAILVDTVNEV